MRQRALATDTFSVFGTTAVLVVTDPAALRPARGLADAELAAIDKACSRFRPDSEISIVNNCAGRLISVSELFATLLETALRAAELTDGDVDPTCGRALIAAGYDRDFADMPARTAPEDETAPPDQTAPPDKTTTADQTGPAGGTGPADGTSLAKGTGLAAEAVPGWRGVLFDAAHRMVRLDHGVRLDFGATAKAWAADRCAGLIAASLRCGVLISLGGALSFAGPPPADGWQVRVTDDHAAAQDAAGQTVTIRAGGLATSSTTVRAWTAGGRGMHHIIDPRTGEPARSVWRTVSVTAATCVDANIASTASIIRGDAAPAWLDQAGLPARLVRHDGTVLTVAGWPADAA